MSRIVLIACAKGKARNRVRASLMYQSPLFQSNLRFAKTLAPSRIFILSALHGLLPLDQVIDPYDLTLNRMSDSQIQEWSKKVLWQMASAGLDHAKDEFIFLAGDKYRKYLAQHLANVKVPMAGLSIGKQLQFLSNKR